jgi:hypothetical protein
MQEDIAAPAIGEASDVNPSVATAPVEERTAGRHGVRRRRVLAWCSIVVGVLAAAALAAASVCDHLAR